MQLVVDGLLTQYMQSGSGPTVVLLHGWGDNAQSLSSIQAGLAAHFTILTPDLPGFGGSQSPDQAWGLDDYAQFVAKFLDKLQLTAIHALVGHSNGGAIAIRGLSKGILTADRLVLLASAGIRNQYKGRHRALRYLAKAGKLVTMPLPVAAKRRLRQQVYRTIGSDMLVAEHLQDSFRKVVTDDVQADAARIAIPTLLIYGEADEQTPVRFGERFHQLIDGSTLEVLPSVGHFVHLERPQLVLKSVEEFLQ